MKEVLSNHNIEFVYFDISLDFGALKRFLKIRDTNSIYEPVKEAGRVGIPTVLVENEVMLDPCIERIKEILG